MTRQLEMFAETAGPVQNWLPKLAALPLGDDAAVALDTETTGLDVATGKSRAVGVSIYSPSRRLAYYLPFGHESGQQLELEHVRRYLLDQLPGKRVLLANARFDVHSLRTIGVDLEALGCEVHDVLHAAALLDEQRRSYSLDNLAKDLLGSQKVTLPADRLAIHEKPSHVVAPYAAQDARLAWDLGGLLAPKLTAERLDNVMELEDELVYATCEMERNGTHLDVEKLEAWNTATARRYQDTVLELYQMVGFRVVPTSPVDLLRMCTYLGVPLDPKEVTPGGKPQFTDEVLKRLDDVPAVRLAREGRQLASLQSKYLEKYLTAADVHGILRYQLNQLRSDEYGTVTGRYSSSNINIQQVFSVDRQEGPTKAFPVRNLFVPAAGKTWCLADASQIEFRIFAHYSEDEKLIAAYRDDPLTDFHQQVAKLTGLTRSDAKHINFGKLYGMGIDRMISETRKRGGTASDEDVLGMFQEYDRRFPAVRRLLNRAASLAKRRGYVRTGLGRRRRFGKDESTHAALNAVIQGTAADVMKLKLLEAYRHRKELGLTLRFTVHDELDGDLDPDPRAAARLRELLDAPVRGLEFKVPIRWEVKTGRSWGETK